MGSSARSPHSSLFSVSRALELRGRQQVAAVCYRVSARGPEFLLVRTRGGRWIFPKGGVQRGLSHAQSAALEAFEEAGVHGRIEEMPFARYQYGKPTNGPHRRSRRKSAKPVIAHLCKVSHLERPQEAKRKPTWFTPEKAKKRLSEDRRPEFGEELAAVVDRAVSRIQRIENESVPTNGIAKRDELLRVSMEPPPTTRLKGAALIRYFLLEGRRAYLAPAEVRRKTHVVNGIAKIRQAEPNLKFERIPLRLTDGTPLATDSARNVGRIDRKLSATSMKPKNSFSRT